MKPFTVNGWQSVIWSLIVADADIVNNIRLVLSQLFCFSDILNIPVIWLSTLLLNKTKQSETAKVLL
jgi:hypothetical protein